MKTLYEKVLERYPNGKITADKTIKRFCPSDLLSGDVDDCDGEKVDESICDRCWSKPYNPTEK